jgi:hypothetical protein
MAVLTANASAGATSITVDALGGSWPVEVQFRLAVGNEIVTVVGPVPLSTTLTVTALVIAHKAGENVALYDPVQGVRGELVADVRITDEGLVVENGKIFIRDTAGQSVLSAAGFEGSWLDFLNYGGYNATFAAGTTNNITAATIVGTASTAADYLASLSPDIPYWVVSGVGSGARLARVADANMPGGFVTRFTQFSGTTSTGTVLLADFPIMPGARYAVRIYAKASVGGENPMNVTAEFRDKNHAAITASGLSFTPTLSTSFAEYEDVTGDTTMSDKARFLRVALNFAGVALNRTIDVAYVVAQQFELRAPINVTAGIALDPSDPAGGYGYLSTGRPNQDGIQIDRNSIQAHDGTPTVAELALNPFGGRVQLGAGTEVVIDGGVIVMNEQSGAVGLAGSNKANLYITDDGSGKTSLRVRFQSGGAQVIANEP